MQSVDIPRQLQSEGVRNFTFSGFFCQTNLKARFINALHFQSGYATAHKKEEFSTCYVFKAVSIQLFLWAEVMLYNSM